MYDTQTQSRWSQLFGEAVQGPMQGQKLEKLPSIMTTWRQWRELHPDTTVYIKSSIPYRSSFTAETFSQIAREEAGPVQGKDLVIGVEGHVTARAYLVRALAETRLMNDQLEESPILVYLSPDLATFRVFGRRVQDRTLTFSIAEGDKLVDGETRSLWDPISGKATSGPLRGEGLPSLVATYSLWFAWQEYRPDSELVESFPAE